VDLEFLTGTFIRTTHMLFGVIWLGAVYYLLLIQSPALAAAEPGVRKGTLSAVMPRALAWVRWSSMITLLLGVALFTWEYHRVEGGLGVNHAMKVDGKVTDRALFTMTAMTLAILLWFVIWFLIWPTWRKILGTLGTGETPAPALMKRAHFLAQFNFVLSGPMLWLMIAPQHYRADFTPAALGAFFVVGMGVMIALLAVGGRSRAG